MSDGIELGEKWRKRLYRELRAADAVVCVITTRYLASEWCTAEVGIADAWGLRLLPVLVDPGVTSRLLADRQFVRWSITHVKPRPRFAGCNAGHTFLHVDPHGSASICKVARDQQIDLTTEGIAGLARLGGIADALMLRTDGCSGCQLAEQCSVCRPLAKLYQQAKAPLDRYCQHAERRNNP